jgi:uncharacterized OsmC-like protein
MFEPGVSRMNEPVRVSLTQTQDYRFAVDFGEGRPGVVTDEGPPLGSGSGPSPLHLLLAAVADCMASSLLFALRKYHDEGGTIRAEAMGRVGRSARGRLRVESIELALHLGVPASRVAHLERIVAQFEDFCTVGQSVRRGIPVTVRLYDADGVEVPGLVAPPD